MSEKEKILSIIVPSYNMEKYLPKCLGSLIVAPELMDRLEVLVVNDGSKDRTREIAHEFAVKWPGTFRVIDKENGHYGSCINAALKVATGVFVKILDADDSFDVANFESWLREVANRIDSGELAAVDLLLTNFVTANEDGAITSVRRNQIRRGLLSIRQIPRHYVFQMHAIAYRAEMLRELGYVQTEGIMYTDTEWSVYPMAGVRNIFYWPVPVYQYLVGREGQSMDPSVFLKCVDQRIRMYMRMARESCDAKWGSEARYRMRFQVLIGMKALYLGACRDGLCACNARMGLIDRLVQKYGEDVYSMFNSITISRFNRYRIVRAWRKHGRLSKCQYGFVRTGDFILSLVEPVKRFVKNLR